MNGNSMGQGQVLGSGVAYASGYGTDKYAAAEQLRSAEIPHQMQMMENALKDCMQGVDVLGAKLEGSVMRSAPPAAASGCGAPIAVPATPYGHRLQELVSVAAMLNERIQSLSARLEV